MLSNHHHTLLGENSISNSTLYYLHERKTQVLDLVKAKYYFYGDLNSLKRKRKMSSYLCAYLSILPDQIQAQGNYQTIPNENAFLFWILGTLVQTP